MNKTAQLFYDVEEPFAAGFFEEPEASVAKRFCRAYRRFYETCPPPEYKGEPLYPSGKIDNGRLAVKPHYCRQYSFNYGRLDSKNHEAATVFALFDKEHSAYFYAQGRDAVLKNITGTDVWNHSALNHKRINAEGLDRYEERVRAMRDNDLREALLDVLMGIRNFHSRVIVYLEEVGAEERLIAALKKVPFKPAETAYEALVSTNFMFAFDGCDNLGYVDGWLPQYWKGEDLTAEMHCIMHNLQRSAGWSITVGPEYSDLTKQWIKASEGLARPMVELRTVKDMPSDIWETALDRVLKGGGQPSFYNEKAIQERLRDRLPNAPKEDIYEFAGMGCTETSFSGMTYCGGIDVNLNVLKIFEEAMKEDLALCKDFESFYEAFFARVHRAQDNVISYVNNYYHDRARLSFAPIRTLFTDDCIEKEKGYYQGGARYTFAIPSDSGIPNTVDSLLAVKDLIYGKKLYTAEEFISALEEQDVRFLTRLRSCPSYGTGDVEANDLIHSLTKRFYSYYKDSNFEMGCGFFPTSHQFQRHVPEGKAVGHTPDGRKAGQPLADSIAAVNGKAVKGPTLMLSSAACYSQDRIYGIPVLNLSITRKFNTSVLRALIEGYFDMGGTQIQITCVDKETLLDAKKNPDAHRDLVVRVGGYSEYFRNISSDLQDADSARTMFEG